MTTVDRVGIRAIRGVLRLMPGGDAAEWAEELLEVVEVRRAALGASSRASAVLLFWARESWGAGKAVAAAWQDHLVPTAGPCDRLRLDLRSSLRGLARKPAQLVSMVSLLTLGIGATAGIGSVAWALLVAPLPFPEADRLVRLYHDADLTMGISHTELARYRSESRTLDDVAGWRSTGSTYRPEDGAALRISVVRVTPNLFEVLGRAPELGRAFVDGSDRGIILSHRFWADRLGSDPDVLDRGIVIDDERRPVRGVLSPDLAVPDPAVDAYITEPWLVDNRGRSGPWFDVVGRLAPGVALATASVEVDVLARAMRSRDPRAYEAEPDFGGHVEPLRDGLSRSHASLALAVTGAAGTLLLATLLNVAILYLARAERGRDEISLRSALGARAADLSRLRLCEHLLIAVPATAAATLLAAAIGRVAMGLFPGDALPTGRIPAEAGPPLAVGLGVTAIAMLGLVTRIPAGSPGPGLPGASRSTPSAAGIARWIPIQVALASVLLSGAALLTRSVSNLMAVDPGFRAEGVMTARISLPAARYPTASQTLGFFETLAQRIGSGQAHAGFINSLPLSAYGGAGDAVIEHVHADSAVAVVAQRLVGGSYFDVMDIPLLAGRWFEPRDRQGAQRVVIVDDVFAGRWFGSDQQAVGRRIRFFMGGDEWNEIVGVVGSVRHDGLRADPTPMLYVPFAQRPTGEAHLVVAGGSSAAATIRAAVQEIDPGLAVFDVGEMRERLRSTLSRERLALTLFASFALVAVMLAALGTYGALELARERQERELGIRIALGAHATDIVRTVAGGLAAPLALGIVLGTIIATVAGHALRSLLYGVAISDPISIAATSATLGLVVLIAIAPGVVRTLHADPARVLRAE